MTSILKSACFGAKFGFDTDENEPSKVFPLSVYRSPRLQFLVARKMVSGPRARSATWKALVVAVESAARYTAYISAWGTMFYESPASAKSSIGIFLHVDRGAYDWKLGGRGGGGRDARLAARGFPFFPG